MDLELKGKCALVTGSSRGLGLPVPGRWSPKDARCASARDGKTGCVRRSGSWLPWHRRGPSIHSVVRRRVDRRRCRSGGARDSDSSRRSRHPREQRRPRPAAAASSTPRMPSGRRPSTTRCSRRFVPRASRCRYLRQRGGGVIIMIASIYGRESGGRMVYNAVKAAEISLAKSLARELASDRHPREQRGAGVDPVPGRDLGGSGSRRTRRGLRSSSGGTCRAGRFGRAEEVGDVVAFLCLRTRELDHRGQHHRGWLPVPVVDLTIRADARVPARRLATRGAS